MAIITNRTKEQPHQSKSSLLQPLFLPFPGCQSAFPAGEYPEEKKQQTFRVQVQLVKFLRNRKQCLFPDHIQIESVDYPKSQNL